MGKIKTVTFGSDNPKGYKLEDINEDYFFMSDWFVGNCKELIKCFMCRYCLVNVEEERFVKFDKSERRHLLSWSVMVCLETRVEESIDKLRTVKGGDGLIKYFNCEYCVHVNAGFRCEKFKERNNITTEEDWEDI